MQYRHPLQVSRDILQYGGRFRPGTYWLTVVAAIAAIFTMQVGNVLLSHPPSTVPPVIWALWDAPIHALLAICVLLPLLIHVATPQRQAVLICLAAAAAIFIDLDHFVAARSLSLAAALHLPMRPVTHSLLFALLAAIGLWSFRRNLATSYAVCTALASHVLRDSVSGATPVLWPFPIFQLPAAIAFTALIMLCGLSLLVATRLARHTIPIRAQAHPAPTLPLHAGQASFPWQSTSQTAEVVLSIEEPASTTANPWRSAMPR